MKTLNDVRISQKITLEELADEMEISQSYCSLLLNGKRRMSLDNANKIAEKFGIDINDVYTYYNFAKCKEKS